MLQCDYFTPPDRYNQVVEGHLWETGFYHISHIGIVQYLLALVNTLIERWRPETHTFYLPVGECAMTLEDVAIILGLLTNGLPVTEPTLSSYEALEAEYLDQFGVAPRKTECRGSFIKLTWFRALKDRIVLADNIQIQRYVKCHIILLFCTVIFGDKSGAGVHWKFLPLLHNFSGIIQFSWDRWHNWECADRPYRYRSLAHFRRALDDLQEGHFVWEAYAMGRIEAHLIPPDIRQHSAIWSAIIPLISFECIEWHASNRLRRHFGLTQGISHQEWDLGEAHGEVLTGPKNQDWSRTHSFWVMHSTN
ncbi:serine/threonine-protein phosphatase 7 long form homolog [Arachis hypogaea]|uniref:serine/threonine-protein phosphatase 7 long form homolog n=1 Tax=Arachis hypogaea TaxID=3818 RepID=UPI003B21897E